MTKRLGIIQTRGIGDIIIALPIADHYIANGYEIYWPIDERYCAMFKPIKPSINFVPVPHRDPPDYDYFLTEPLDLLRQYQCEKTLILYSYLGEKNIADPRLTRSLKFDEYKYAIAGVPFERKWTLDYTRDLDREHSLFEKLDIDGEYACVHDQAWTMKDSVEVTTEMTGGLPVVRISALTDSIFDWRLVIERAAKLIMVDSCYANLVEQLNLENDKSLILYSPVSYTPVFKNGWKFVFPRAGS